jgi:hypothetical protein
MLWGQRHASRGRARARHGRRETTVAGRLRLVELMVPGEVMRQARGVLELSREVGALDAPGFETETQVLQVALLHGLVSMGERYRDAFEAARAERGASA